MSVIGGDSPDFTNSITLTPGSLLAELVFVPTVHNYHVNIPATASGVTLYANCDPTLTGVQVYGDSTGILYVQTGVGLPASQFPMVFQVPVSVEASINIQVTNTDTIPLVMYVVASNTVVGGPSAVQPQLSDPVRWVFRPFAASVNGQALLPAPGPGNGWDIRQVNMGGTVTVAGQRMILQGSVTGSNYFGPYAALGTGVMTILHIPCDYVISEGLNLNTNCGTSTLAFAVARQVVLGSGGKF